MVDKPLGLALLFVLGISAQWIAWRVRLPSILLLLCVGFLAGPIFGWIRPDELIGSDLIAPIVGLSVSIILFEGGLTLHLRDLKGGTGKVVRNLVSVGMLFTWLAVGGAVMLFFDLSWELALLLGSALVISGPTVVGPLLDHIRPTGPVGRILKWEGIVIDPVGAIAATLWFEVIDGHFKALDGSFQIWAALSGLGQTVFWGGLMGLLGATLIVALASRHWMPDRLEIPITLTTVLAVSAVSNTLMEESGLLAVTVMGIVLANQRKVSIKGILHFKENLVVLLISVLFVLLAARMERSMLLSLLSWRGFAFLLVVMLLIRPAAVLLSTFRSKLEWREKAFLACMAPRGIVSAAVVPLFALRLMSDGIDPGEDQLVTITFLTIIGTVAVSGLISPWIARRLGLAQADPQGVLILGANPIGLELARALKAVGQRALLVDTNWSNVRKARLDGFEATYGNLLEPEILSALDLGGIGRLIAVVPNDEVNALAAIHCSEIFGRRNCYQIARRGDSHADEHFERELRGRTLGNSEADYGELRRRIAEGHRIKATPLTEEFTHADFLAIYGEDVLELFTLDERGKLHIAAHDRALDPEPGETLMAWVREPDEERTKSEAS